MVSSLDNCAYYCGFCGEFVVHCYWAKDKCAYYCGFCGVFVVHPVTTVRHTC